MHGNCSYLTIPYFVLLHCSVNISCRIGFFFLARIFQTLFNILQCLSVPHQQQKKGKKESRVFLFLLLRYFYRFSFARPVPSLNLLSKRQHNRCSPSSRYVCVLSTVFFLYSLYSGSIHNKQLHFRLLCDPLFRFG